MVKMAYEDIMSGFDKEASTAFDRWVFQNPKHSSNNLIHKHMTPLDIAVNQSKVHRINGEAMREALRSGNPDYIDFAKKTIDNVRKSDARHTYAKLVLRGKTEKSLGDIRLNALTRLPSDKVMLLLAKYGG